MRFHKKPLSRRDFIRNVGRGAGAIGLASTLPGLLGCGQLPPLFSGNEMVGRVTATSAGIRLVTGDVCDPTDRFVLVYDTVPRSAFSDYRYQSAELSGFSPQDAITFNLQGLSSNTRYYYRLGHYRDGEGWIYRNECSFHTRRAPGRNFRFCLTGDLHVYPYPFFVNEKIRQRVLANVLTDAPDILLTLGDNEFVAFQGDIPYPFSPESFLGTYRRSRTILDVAGHSMFVLPVLGNHEGLFGFTAAQPEYQSIRDARLRYLPLPGSTTFSGGGDPDGRYGAFTWGDVLFVWLDILGFCAVDPYLNGPESYILGGAQRAFLEQSLASSSAPWKFVFAHHIFGGDDDWWAAYGRGNANDAHQYEQAQIQSLLEQYGVQIFFYGHDHVFSMSRANSVSYVCVGHGGSGCPWVEEALQYYPPDELFVTDAQGHVPPGHVRVDVDAVRGEVRVSYILASLASDNGSVLSSLTFPAAT